MADVVEGAGEVPAVEQESRSFELPTAADPVDDAAAAEDKAPPPPADGGSSSSSDDEDEKKPALPPSDELPPGSESAAMANGGGRWNQLINHPYVAATASTLRQRAGQAQERMQPIVNHPYVQKGTGAIYAGGTKTLETGKKMYNREEGYEPKRLVPFFIATVGLVALGLLIRGMLTHLPPQHCSHCSQALSSCSTASSSISIIGLERYKNNSFGSALQHYKIMCTWRFRSFGQSAILELVASSSSTIN